MTETIEQLYEDHLKKEPKKRYLWFDKGARRGIETDAWSKWNFDKKRLKNLVDIGKEKREEILNEIKTGKTLGEVCKVLNQSLDIVGDVLFFNIKKNEWLSLQGSSL